MDRSDEESIDKLITETIAIETEDAKQAGKVGYMARALVQATLPHKATTEKVFTRRNGALEMTIMSPHGLPYGSVPRLLLSWMTTEAVRTRSPVLVLGSSLSAFMAELDLGRRGGKRGDITRFKTQTMRLFSSAISCSYADETMAKGGGFNIAKEYHLWWNPKQPQQLPLWKSSVVLSTDFFNEIIEKPVPIDMDALLRLKRSPMALDIYFWLTYRLSYLHKDLLLPWPLLQMQFGSDYAHDTEGQYNFKRKFLMRLKDVLAVYDKARVFDANKGLLLKPSPPHVARRHLPDPLVGRGRLRVEAQKDRDAFKDDLAQQLCLSGAVAPIRLKTFTYEKAKAVLAGSGLDIYALEADWLEWIEKTGKRPAAPDAAFVGFCRKKAQK